MAILSGVIQDGLLPNNHGHPCDWRLRRWLYLFLGPRRCKCGFQFLNSFISEMMSNYCITSGFTKLFYFSFLFLLVFADTCFKLRRTRGNEYIQEKAKKVVVVGGGYIGMEVAAAVAAWKIDTTIIFPEDHLMARLFTPSLAQKYEQLYKDNGTKIFKGASITNLEGGSDGRVVGVKLADGSTIEADTVVVGIGAKPAVSPFEMVGLNNTVRGIQASINRLL
ncbi:hypothetical protein OROMI_003282 [Orobanche minor]